MKYEYSKLRQHINNVKQTISGSACWNTSRHIICKTIISVVSQTRMFLIIPSLTKWQHVRTKRNKKMYNSMVAMIGRKHVLVWRAEPQTERQTYGQDNCMACSCRSTKTCQSVCLSHGDFDSRFAQAGQAEKHLVQLSVPGLSLERVTVK